MIRINNFSVREHKVEVKNNHRIQSGIITYGARPLLFFEENLDSDKDMQVEIASKKITPQTVQERQAQLRRMYFGLLRIGNFNVFRPFEMIVHDVLDLNETCIKGKERAEKDGFKDAGIAISVAGYGGEICFNHFWFSYHADLKKVTQSSVRNFYHEQQKLVEKKKFKKREEDFTYQKLLLKINFDLRQNILMEKKTDKGLFWI